ncbi:MAG: alpha,alpha-trehalose-phosphate synthase (UDP-forming) [Burkholderiales bacterium]
MRLSLRFIVPLALVLAVMAYAVTPLVDQLTLRWFVRDLDIRSTLITSTVQEQLYASVQAGRGSEVKRFLATLTQDERLYAAAFCDPSGKLVYRSVAFPDGLACADHSEGATASWIAHLKRGPVHVGDVQVKNENQVFGSLILVHDMSFVQRRSEDTKRYLFYLFAGIAAVVSIVTVAVAELSFRGWMQGLKKLISTAQFRRPSDAPELRELRPVAKDLQALVRELEADRRTRDDAQTNWTSESLRLILRDELKGEAVLIVSNREPYIHVHDGDWVEVRRPASGLVTALEPVMRACSGTWIAHGAGSADRETVDAHDRVRVPPGRPAYAIRRIWMSPEEEQGYYYGFSNEGIWPLCHIAHVRPTFKSKDWKMYQAVNRRFADAVAHEAKRPDPIVLVQDYHFALLPRLIHERLPAATVIMFWHIPWPNPETFGICPWREEILEGMLGADILGFHTQFHCNNFLDTADRFLEARVDRESFNISYGGELTAVRRYPISIAWPLPDTVFAKSVAECRRALQTAFSLAPGVRLGVGVDRLDYTKGILERFLAVERLLEMHPEWIGRFSFLQIAAPSRSSIEEYQHFELRARALAQRINDRFGRDDWQPILLKVEHYDSDEVYECFRAANLCFVSSLHDGMNLVAKEFVACRDDERGVLILSQFAGASRELVEALIVNPYDVDQCAAALHGALTMPDQEQHNRMRSMRGLIQEFNVYRWAGRMLLDAARMRMRRQVLESGVPAARRSAVKS